MRLDVDLGFDAVPGRTLGAGEAQALDLHTIAAALRKPGQLLALLRGRRFEEVRVREGELPPSALQAVALLCLGAVRARRFLVEERAFSRLGFLARATARTARAVPAELLRSA